MRHVQVADVRNRTANVLAQEFGYLFAKSVILEN
jgi:hypothetical protein